MNFDEYMSKYPENLVVLGFYIDIIDGFMIKSSYKMIYYDISTL